MLWYVLSCFRQVFYCFEQVSLVVFGCGLMYKFGVVFGLKLRLFGFKWPGTRAVKQSCVTHGHFTWSCVPSQQVTRSGTRLMTRPCEPSSFHTRMNTRAETRQCDPSQCFTQFGYTTMSLSHTVWALSHDLATKPCDPYSQKFSCFLF